MAVRIPQLPSVQALLCGAILACLFGCPVAVACSPLVCLCVLLRFSVRIVAAIVKGVGVGAALAIIESLAFCIITVVFIPTHLVVICSSLCGRGSLTKCRASFAVLALLPRVPLALVFGFLLGLFSGFFWVWTYTMAGGYAEEPMSCHPNEVLFGGIVGEDGVCKLSSKLIWDFYHYHSQWGARPIVPPVPAPVGIHPTSLGAREDSEHRGDDASYRRDPVRRQHLAVTTWRHIYGEIDADAIWDHFFTRCIEVGLELTTSNLLTVEAVETVDTSVILGIPALVLLRLLERSVDNDGFMFKTGLCVSEDTRPHDPFSAQVWATLCQAKEAYKKACPMNDHDWEHMQRIICSGQHTESTLAPTRCKELNWVVAAVMRIVYPATRHRIFKENFMKSMNVLQSQLAQATSDKV